MTLEKLLIKTFFQKFIYRMYLKIKRLDLIDLIKEHGVNNERLAHIILAHIIFNVNFKVYEWSSTL